MDNVRLPILVHHKHIEPIFFVSWHVHSYAIAAELKVHAGIFDVANSVETKPSLTLSKEDGTNRYTWVSLVYS